MYIPVGFAHGFCSISDTAEVLYKIDNLYDPKDEYGIIYNDSDIGIDWRIENPTVSEKDMKHVKLSDMPEELLF